MGLGAIKLGVEEVTLGTRGTLGCHAPTHTVKPDVNIVLKMMALYFPQ